MAMLGGAGHIGGALLGAALVTLARDALQDLLPLLGRRPAQAEIVVFGVLFILVLQTARGGIIPALAAPAAARRAPPPPRRRAAAAAPHPAALRARCCWRSRAGAALRRAGGGQRRLVRVRAGEIVGLIGPNGAGKSTIFNLITGALPPSAGRVRFRGDDITGLPARRIARARPGAHVPARAAAPRHDAAGQRRCSAPTCAATPGVLARRAAARPRRGARGCAPRRCASSRASAWASAPHELAGNLPLGRQRVLEVARALAADPVLIVLDEPAAGLRRLEKKALAELLRSCARRA